MKPGAENRSENSFKLGTLEKRMALKMDIITPFFSFSFWTGHPIFFHEAVGRVDHQSAHLQPAPHHLWFPQPAAGPMESVRDGLSSGISPRDGRVTRPGSSFRLTSAACFTFTFYPKRNSSAEETTSGPSDIQRDSRRGTETFQRRRRGGITQEMKAEALQTCRNVRFFERFQLEEGLMCGLSD